MVIERRQAPRYSAHVSASIKVAGQQGTLAVMVEDLCVLGCLLEYAPMLEPDQECEFALTWKGREFRTLAVVVWKGERNEAGLKFHHTDHEQHALLRAMCNEFLEKPLVRLPEGEK